MPTSTKRPAQGAWTENVAASATAKTVPAAPRARAMSVSSAPRERVRGAPRRASAAKTRSRARPRSPTTAIQSEFTIGPQALRSAKKTAPSWRSRRTGGHASIVQVSRRHERDEHERRVRQEQDARRAASARRGHERPVPSASAARGGVPRIAPATSRALLRALQEAEAGERHRRERRRLDHRHLVVAVQAARRRSASSSRGTSRRRGTAPRRTRATS